MIGRVVPALARSSVPLLLCAVVASCSHDASARQTLARADTLLSQRKYPEVIQQSRQLLESRHDDAKAATLLGRAHFELGHFAQAYQYLLQARAHDPGDASLRVDLARLYLAESRLDEAHEQAAAAAAQEPSNRDALVLLAVSARTPKQIDAAMRRLAATPLGAGEVQRSLTLAILSLRKRDTANAGKLLRDAVARDANSPEARAALASFYSLSGDKARADNERKLAAALAPSGSSRRLQLAKFFLSLGQRAEARQWLADTAAADSISLTAQRLLAEVQLDDNDSDALKSIGSILQRDSNDVEALLQRSRARQADRDLSGAVADLQRVAKASPGLAPAHYQLALVEVSRAESAVTQQARDSAMVQASTELQAAIKLAGSFPDALFKLSELKIRSGQAKSAIGELDHWVSVNPGSIRGHELLAAALEASGRSDEANETYRQVVAINPERPESHYELGVELQTHGNAAEATREFEAAVALAPAYADPMTQIVLIDLATGRSTAALDRLNQQIARAPRSGALYDLVGLVRAARGELGAAEAAYRRAVDLEPGLTDARVRLAELYAGTGRYDLALQQADSALRFEPTNARAMMTLGVAYQQRGDTARARQAYETVLSRYPGFVNAANNLALLLADEPGQLERAFKLASVARDNAPNDPHVADTFGWLLYKRGDYGRAMSTLQQSAAKLADSPTVLYHLGMAAQKMGDKDTARAALAKAAASPTEFPGKDEARRALAELK